MASNEGNSSEIFHGTSSDNSIRADIITIEQRKVFDVINFVLLCSLISILGIIANILNIAVFFKQGFTNTVNISFFGLAISDVCCLITLLWVGVCLNPLLENVGLPWIPAEFQYLTGAWPHIICGRITSYITAYVTFERCLCIAAPLKVKNIITPCRTKLAVCLIYLLNTLTLIPEYATSYFDWMFIQNLNRTVLTMAFTGSRHQFIGLVFFLNFVTGIVSFLAVIIFTIILIITLRRNSKFRKEIASGMDTNGSLSGRDKKTVKMIVLIASVLIVCYTPGTFITLTTFVEPEFMLSKRYENMCFAMWSIGFVFQAVNSSVNILLYYKMSSKYRETFYELFVWCRWHDQTLKEQDNKHV